MNVYNMKNLCTKRFVVLMQLLCLFLTVNAQRIKVPVEICDMYGMCIANSTMEFLKNGKCYIIKVVCDSGGYGELVEFCADKEGCVSTAYRKNGVRFWLTGAYLNADDTVRDYFLAIFDPVGNGDETVYFKTAPADKSTMSASKYQYILKKNDWDTVFRNFITPATLDLKVASQGDTFGDGDSFNEQVNK